MKTIQLFSLLLVFTACTFHRSTLSGGNGVALVGQQVATRTAHGSSQTTHFLGLGGMNREALLLEARMNMLNSYPLEKGELIGQTLVDVKKVIFFPYSSQKVTMSADYLRESTDAATLNNETSHASIAATFTPGETVIIWASGSFHEATYAYQSAGNHYVFDNDKQNARRLIKVVKSRLMNRLDLTLTENQPELANLFTPSNPIHDLIHFQIGEEAKKGELLRKDQETYLVSMVHKNGSSVAVIIPKSAMIEIMPL